MAVLRIAAGLMKEYPVYFKKTEFIYYKPVLLRLKSGDVSMAMTAILLFLALSLVMLGPEWEKYVINGIGRRLSTQPFSIPLCAGKHR